MAADLLALAGPPQRGQGNCGQHAYWICMPHPLPETVEQSGVKTPEDFDRQSFRELVVVAHSACGVELLEGVYLLEPHAYMCTIVRLKEVGLRFGTAAPSHIQRLRGREPR